MLVPRHFGCSFLTIRSIPPINGIRSLFSPRVESMCFAVRRLVALACLLAYLVAGAQATLSAGCGCAGHTCKASREADQLERAKWTSPSSGVSSCRSACPARSSSGCGAAGLAIFGSPLKWHPGSPTDDEGSFPGCPACPGKCHLCCSGAIPYCFTPACLLSPQGCLGQLVPEYLLQHGQVCPDEMIRPPMC